ncbi:MAG: glycosyl transferase [Clostridia bacterium]|nr:glycosyl transferase [Clostridia bacterium]
MSVFRYIRNFFLSPKSRFYYLTRIGITKLLSDKKFIETEYRVNMGKKLNLSNPQTYNEKIQWLKLYDHNPEYTVMVDKYEAKKYVAKIIGDEYIIPTLGVWTRFDDIDFTQLPDQFVLKCTHDSGGIYICKDKKNFDPQEARKKIESSLKTNYFYEHREWPYKNVKPRIIAEKYMEDRATQELRDYKFFAFNGEPKAVFIAKDRLKDEETKFDFFDMDFNHLDFTNGHPNAPVLPEKPVNFELMKALAAKLSMNIPHVRVDFYEVNGKVYFGELTFSHWSGIVPFDPEKWDYIFGEWITLPQKTAS